MAMSSAFKADLMLVAVTLLAAASWIFSKEAVLLMPPLLFMALRFLLAAALLAVFARDQLRSLKRAQWRAGLRTGLVFGFGMSCWITGLQVGNHIGEGAFLTNLGVVLVPFMAHLLFRETAPATTWLALPVACSGLGLLFLSHGFRFEAGQLFYVTSAVIFSLYYILVTRAANDREVMNRDGLRRQRERVPALALTTLVMLTVGLLSVLLSALLEPWRPTFSHFSVAMAGWIVASAVIGSAARFLLQTYAQSLSAHSHGVVIMVVEPVWTALLAAFWFGETMTPTQLAGCSLILAALLISRAAALARLVRAAWRPAGAV